MTFASAAVVVLAAAVIALGLLAYHLFSRLHVLEEAVSGGMRTPSRTLSREEFARRFTTARHRSEFAREVDDGVLLVLDDGTASEDLLRALDHLATQRGFTLGFAGSAPSTLAHGSSLEDLGSRLDLLGISVLPHCLVIDQNRILESRAVGSAAALESLLLEVA